MDDNEFLSIMVAVIGGVIILLAISSFVFSAKLDASEKYYELEKMRIEYEYLGEPVEGYNNEI